MDWLVVEGVKPWDGRYELNLADDPLLYDEWGWIKRHSGYMPLTIEEGFNGGDPELMADLACIALHRAGKLDVRDFESYYKKIGSSPFGTNIRFEGDEEVDAGPPETRANGSPASSGLVSPKSSGSSDASPSRSGTPASDSSASVPVTSGP